MFDKVAGWLGSICHACSCSMQWLLLVSASTALLAMLQRLNHSDIAAGDLPSLFPPGPALLVPCP
jgi:hypothetical protein